MKRAEEKTKEELIDELEQMRQQVAGFEALESERKRAEEELKLRVQLLDAASDSINLADFDGNLLYVNETFCRSNGYSREELIGINLRQLDLPEYGKLLERRHQEVREKGHATFESAHLRKDGSIIPVEVHARVIESGNRKLILSVDRDVTERKRAEEALKESEEKFRAIFDGATDGILLADAESKRFYSGNKMICQMLGYSLEELQNLTPMDIHPEEEVPHAMEQFEKPSRGEITPAEDTLMKRKDGSIFYADAKSSHEIHLAGKAYVVGIFRDITERKRAEEQMRIKDSAMASSINAIVMANLEGNLTYINESFLKMWGYDSEKEVLGKLATGFWQTPEKAGKVVDALTNKGSWVGELTAKKKDGSLFDVQLSASMVIDKDGKPICMMASFVDMTKRKQAEEELRESEERYRALLELGAEVGEAVIMAQDTEQGDAIHIFVNKEWPRITGYSKKELLSMSFFDLVHPKDYEATLERHRKKMRGESIPGLFEISIIRKDGTEVPIELTSAYTTYRGKRANVAYVRDITERKRIEEQLIVTDRLASVGELASGIAHELSNPLTSVIGLSDLLLDKDLPDDVKEDVEVINREAQRTAQVVRNLLTFARKHPQEKQSLDINNAIEKVLGLRAYEQKVNNIQVNTQFAPDLPEIMADGFQLQQVFLNIIIDAEYFMTEAHRRGTLTITTERVGDIIRASFADDGPGIAKENLGHVFDPFFTTKEVGKGTGLGLSICHGIVTEHGGRIYAESELGKGTTFVVELPISK